MRKASFDFDENIWKNKALFCAKRHKTELFPTLHRFNILLILHLTLPLYDEYRSQKQHTIIEIEKGDYQK